MCVWFCESVEVDLAADELRLPDGEGEVQELGPGVEDKGTHQGGPPEITVPWLGKYHNFCVFCWAT